MKKLFRIFGLVLLMGLVCGCGLNYKVEKIDNQEVYEIEDTKYVETYEKTDLVKIDVKNYGIMIAELYPDVAPITVKNFKNLVSSNFYDGLIFHRVISDFMIQTGDPSGNGTGGSSETIKGEFSENGVTNELKHTRGVLSMARRGSTPETEETMNSASSQFFIVQVEYPSLDGKYASFGKVINGLEVIDKIASVTTDSSDKPVQDVVIDSISFVKKYE